VTIVREGMRRMYETQEDIYYYITLMNENYPHPALADAGKGAEEGILKGLYLLKGGGETAKKGLRVQLIGSGTILREVMAAADLLNADFGVAADICSATSFNELRRDGMAAERWNMLHPTDARRLRLALAAQSWDDRGNITLI
jgi:pyruvate dehydrogenase E1 component